MLSPLIVALDVEDLPQAQSLVERLAESVDTYKIGLKLFTAYGPSIVEWLKGQSKKIFLDLKFHDIPQTVAEACRMALRLRVDMLTLHCSGGSDMLRRAVDVSVEEAQRLGTPKPLLLGVTVLTSMEDLSELGISAQPLEQVRRLARLAQSSGLDGTVCSPLELGALRKELPGDFRLVTPGVRPHGTELGDQRRVLSPEEAWSAGADAIVVGRPIWQASDPRAMAEAILRSRR